MQPALSAPASKPAPEPARARLRRLLLTEVVAAPARDTAGEKALKYERLMQLLGRVTALAARSTKDTGTARHVSLLAGLLLDVVSAVAAPVGPLRRVLGLGSESFGPPVLKASPAEQAVASVEEARSAVRELFPDATLPRTVIIVDDLDRCMPEVALDVLERSRSSCLSAPRSAEGARSSLRSTSRS
ncbi:P-loop NTPase fold protein [Dactylosporangium sp. CA-092794]|uniref:P-loop NTPase fold protein n=1 Tax=Dactylosporangium sp. CA-092794 TaxID=3239929 RepID=UPI003D8E8A34